MSVRDQWKPACRSVAIACVVVGAATTDGALAAVPAAGDAALIRKLESQNEALAGSVAEMRQLLLEVKRELLEMKQQGSALAELQHAQGGQQLQQAIAEGQQIKSEVVAATQATSEASAPAMGRTAKSEAWDKFSLWGYGEVYAIRPTHHRDRATIDLARAVFGIGYRFDEKTRFDSEYEVEHAVSSADDPGEFEVEQFYVERTIGDGFGARAGLFLIPAGLLNENHEPTNFYGVQRNFVETLIVPSTWREGGLSFYGTTDSGFDWNVGLTTGMDLSKWNFAPDSAPYTSAQELIDNGVAPFQASHQELALANAGHLSQYMSLIYRGVPGLTLGASYFTGQAVPARPDIGSQRTSLWETHVHYQPGRWDLSALYARGTISNTGAANAPFPGTANPMPSRFDGGFVQAAYKLWQSDGYRLAPFARYERYDMGAGYEGIAPGLAATPTGRAPDATSPSSFDHSPVPRDHVVTLGANFYLNPDVVLKIDFQKFGTNTDFTRVDLGLGLQF